jgi:iron(III) transport system permease protein
MRGKELILPAAIMAGLTLFVLYPVFSVLLECLSREGRFSAGNFIVVFTEIRFTRTIANSLWMAGAAAVLSTSFGLILALVVFRTSLPLRRFFGAAAVLPIIIPGFVLTVGYSFLFGRNGLITYRLLNVSWDVYSWKSVLIIQTLDFTTIAFLVISAALVGLNGQQEDAARCLGATEGEVLVTVTIPLIRPAVISALFIVFLGSIADFSTPLIVGGKFGTLASASYAQMVGAYNPGIASTLNAVMLFFSLIAFWGHSRFQTSYNDMRIESGGAGPRPLTLNPALRGLIWTVCLIYCVGVLALLGSVLTAALTKHLGANHLPTLDHFRAIGLRGGEAIIRTVLLAAATSAIVTVAGMGLAYLLTRTRIRAKDAIDFTAMLPFAVPGTFMGIGFAMAFSHPPLILSGTWAIILASTVVRTIPVGLRSAVSILVRQDRSIEDASVSLGASRVGTFWRIIVPSVRPALVAGALYTFITTVQTVGAIIFLISPGKKVLSVEVFEAISGQFIGLAAALSVIMFLIAGAGALLILFIGRKEGTILWLRKAMTANT